MSMANLLNKLEQVSKLNEAMEEILKADESLLKELNYEARCRLLAKVEDSVFKE